MEEQIITDTLNNGQIENVHIAPIGEFYGSDSKGNPIPEKITEKALKDLADKINASGDEVLCDIDHQSCRPGTEKNTSAAGWFTNFIVDPIKGLFAKLNLTKKGKELLENREYRFTSPTFMLDAEGKPVDMHSISLTNTPAFKNFINPIINSEAEKQVSGKDVIKMEITQEDLVSLIKETVTAMNSAPVEEDKKTEETAGEETKPEETENSCGEPEKKKAENGEPENKAEDKPETDGEPDKKAETADKPEEKPVEEKNEVIKEETLNSAPTIGADISGKAEWENLHGKAFWDWLAKNKR